MISREQLKIILYYLWGCAEGLYDVATAPFRRKTIQVYDRCFTFGYRDFNLTLAQRIKLKILGEIKILNSRPQHWTGCPGTVDFFIVSCPLHGLFLDNKHGNEDITRCPRCFDDALREFELLTGQNLKRPDRN